MGLFTALVSTLLLRVPSLQAFPQISSRGPQPTSNELTTPASVNTAAISCNTASFHVVTDNSIGDYSVRTEINCVPILKHATTIFRLTEKASSPSCSYNLITYKNSDCFRGNERIQTIPLRLRHPDIKLNKRSPICSFRLDTSTNGEAVIVTFSGFSTKTHRLNNNRCVNLCDNQSRIPQFNWLEIQSNNTRGSVPSVQLFSLRNCDDESLLQSVGGNKTDLASLTYRQPENVVGSIMVSRM